MLAVRRSALRNPSTWYFTLGLALLVLSLWMPYKTASRTTRVEVRAEALAERLLEATSSFLSPLDAVDVDAVYARFAALAERDLVYTGDLEVIEPPLAGTVLSLRNKHYVFHLAVTPHDPKEATGRDAVPAYEVMAWPRRMLGPGHSAFFHPQNALPAYTRNLARGYHGEGDRRPLPGCAHRQVAGERTTTYRGADDERWIVLPPRPAQ